jgi:hypothetical protein
VPANTIFRASEVLRLSSREHSEAKASPGEIKEPAKVSKLPPPIVEVSSSQKSSESLQTKPVPKVEIENVNRIEKKSHRIKAMA